MASTKPYTVYLYNTAGVEVREGHAVRTLPELMLHGEQPTNTYPVYATSAIGAVRAALVAAARTPNTCTGAYHVGVGSQVDLTLKRLAEREAPHITPQDIVVRAINTYATLKDSADGHVYTKVRRNGKLTVHSVALP